MALSPRTAELLRYMLDLEVGGEQDIAPGFLDVIENVELMLSKVCAPELNAANIAILGAFFGVSVGSRGCPFLHGDTVYCDGTEYTFDRVGPAGMYILRREHDVFLKLPKLVFKTPRQEIAEVADPDEDDDEELVVAKPPRQYARELKKQKLAEIARKKKLGDELVANGRLEPCPEGHQFSKAVCEWRERRDAMILETAGV